jgi:hypothetical protein
MKVIITGGSGLMGRALTQDLTADGHEVIILSRSPQKVAGLPSGAQALGWDARTAQVWAQHAEGADAIVNLAGENLKGEGLLPKRWTRARKSLIRASRLNAGAAVVEAIREARKKPGVLVQASAVGFYGPRGAEKFEENSPPGDDFLADLCQDWEASTAEAEKLGVRRVVVRTGIPLTASDGALPSLMLPFRLFSGNIFGNGRQYYPWIHFDDQIKALRFLIENKQAKGVYNLTAPEPATAREFARALGKAMRRPVWLPTPAFALRLALGEVSTVALDGQRALPARLLEQGFEFRYPQLEPALRDAVAS